MEKGNGQALATHDRSRLFAVSCRAEANVILAIAEDGSGVSTVELGLDDDLQELLASFTGSDGGLLPASTSELYSGRGRPAGFEPVAS